MKKILFFLSLIMSALSLHAQETTKNHLESKALADPQSPLESEAFQLINQSRAANSRPPLQWSDVVAAQARTHSLNMADGKVPFGHQGSKQRYAAIKKVISTAIGFGENVAYNYGHNNPAEIAVEGWLDSEGHRNNIMGNYNLTGVGVAVNSQGEYYFTQIFVRAIRPQASFEGEESIYLYEEAYVSDEPVQLGFTQ